MRVWGWLPGTTLPRRGHPSQDVDSYPWQGLKHLKTELGSAAF